MAMNMNMAAGMGGMLKDGTTLADGVDEAVLKNIGATKQLASIVKTSLGPNGMKKLVVNHLGRTLVTSDCATIARELEVVHPAAQMVSLAAAAQDTEIGDGTNLVVSFAGELLKLAEELLRTGLHTSEIVAGYELAYKECARLLPTLVVDECKDGRSADAIARVLVPVIAAKHAGFADSIAALVATACTSVMAPAPAAPTIKADQVRIAKLRGGDVTASSVMKGLIVMRPSETSVTNLSEAKVAVYNCGLEMATTETKGTVLIRNAEELLNYNKTEERALEAVVKEISDSGARLVVSGGSVSEMAQHFLEKYGLMALKITSKWELRRICGATGATALVRLGAPTPEEMGSVSGATTMELGGRTVTVLRQDASADSKIATVVLRASTASLLDDLERAVDDGVHTVRCACKDGRLVAGAGATEMALATKLGAFAESNDTGMEGYALKKFAEAFECVPRALAENSGLDPTKTVAALRDAHKAGNAKAGVDLGAVDAASAAKDNGVVDVLAVKESALRLAVDAAITVLRVDQIIMSKPAGGPKGPK